MTAQRNLNREELQLLGRKMGVRVKNLLAPKREYDPFYAGGDADRGDAEKFVALTSGMNLNVHIRGIHYRLLKAEAAAKGYGGTPEEWVCGCRRPPARRTTSG